MFTANLKCKSFTNLTVDPCLTDIFSAVGLSCPNIFHVLNSNEISQIEDPRKLPIIGYSQDDSGIQHADLNIEKIGIPETDLLVEPSAYKSYPDSKHEESAENSISDQISLLILPNEINSHALSTENISASSERDAQAHHSTSPSGEIRQVCRGSDQTSDVSLSEDDDEVPCVRLRRRSSISEDDEEDDYIDCTQEYENDFLKENSLNDDVGSSSGREDESRSVSSTSSRSVNSTNDVVPVPKSEVITSSNSTEDARNPSYVPRIGAFYMHDMRNDEESNLRKRVSVEKPRGRRAGMLSDRWLHDRFDPSKQTPLTDKEIIARYGYNIRDSEKNEIDKNLSKTNPIGNDHFSSEIVEFPVKNCPPSRTSFLSQSSLKKLDGKPIECEKSREIDQKDVISPRLSGIRNTAQNARKLDNFDKSKSVVSASKSLSKNLNKLQISENVSEGNLRSFNRKGHTSNRDKSRRINNSALSSERVFNSAQNMQNFPSPSYNTNATIKLSDRREFNMIPRLNRDVSHTLFTENCYSNNKEISSYQKYVNSKSNSDYNRIFTNSRPYTEEKSLKDVRSSQDFRRAVPTMASHFKNIDSPPNFDQTPREYVQRPTRRGHRTNFDYDARDVQRSSNNAGTTGHTEYKVNAMPYAHSALEKPIRGAKRYSTVRQAANSQIPREEIVIEPSIPTNPQSKSPINTFFHADPEFSLVDKLCANEGTISSFSPLKNLPTHKTPTMSPSKQTLVETIDATSSSSYNANQPGHQMGYNSSASEFSPDQTNLLDYYRSIDPSLVAALLQNNPLLQASARSAVSIAQQFTIPNHQLPLQSSNSTPISFPVHVGAEPYSETTLSQFSPHGIQTNYNIPHIPCMPFGSDQTNSPGVSSNAPSGTRPKRSLEVKEPIPIVPVSNNMG